MKYVNLASCFAAAARLSFQASMFFEPSKDIAVYCGGFASSACAAGIAVAITNDASATAAVGMPVVWHL